MNRMSKLALASALALTATFGFAQAQQGNNAPPPQGDQQMAGRMDCGPDESRGDCGEGRHGGERGGRRGRHRMLIDVNADGIINDDEAASLADGIFMRLDQNRDGALTATEFTTPQGHHGGWFNWGDSAEAAAVLKVRTDKFTALDTDKNAFVNKAEFFIDAKAKLAAADTDKDGKVTPWEFRAQN